MIEFLVGVWCGGWFSWSIGRALLRGDHSELAAENREFRTALRHIRGITCRYPDLLSIANYVDAVLGDEAGA